MIKKKKKSWIASAFFCDCQAVWSSLVGFNEFCHWINCHLFFFLFRFFFFYIKETGIWGVEKKLPR